MLCFKLALLFVGAHIMIATGGVIGQANADSLLVYNATIAANTGGQQPYCETHVGFGGDFVNIHAV